MLDNLTDVVLASCSSAAHELRARLVRVVAAGAASTAGHQCCSLQHEATAASAASISDHSNKPSMSESMSAVVTSATDSAAVDGSFSEPADEPAATDGGSARHCVTASGRFSQMCLRKLTLLAGRGAEGSPGSMTAVMLEVAQIALPLLLERCAQVLLAYAEVEEAAAAEAVAAENGDATTKMKLQPDAAVDASDTGLQARASQADSDSTTPGQTAIRHRSQNNVVPQRKVGDDRQQQQSQQQQQEQGSNNLQLQHRCLVEEVTCVLQVLLDLRLDAVVLDDVLEQQPQVAACLHVAHQVHMQQHQQQYMAEQQHQHLPLELQSVGSLGSIAAGGLRDTDGLRHEAQRQQGHLLLLYELLARCVGCRDRSVALLLRQALLSVGRQLYL